MNRRSTLSASLLAGLTFLAAAGLPARHAAAQTALPPEIVTATTLDDGQKQALGAFVTARREGLDGDDTQIRRARNAILDPLKNPQASVSFRIEYAKLVMPLVEPLAQHKRDDVAVNSLRIAGELASPSSTPVLVRGLTDQRISVRYGAAFGFKRLFEELAHGTPALAAKAATDAVANVAAAIGTEQDPVVLEGLVRALDAAARIPESKLKGVRPDAFVAMCRAVGARAGAEGANGNLSPVFLRAGLAIRNILTSGAQNQAEAELGAGAKKESAGLAGDILAYVRRRVTSGGAGAEEFTQLSALVAVAEAMYSFSNTGAPTDKNLAQLIAAGTIPAFTTAVDEYIGASGLLTKPPFSFPPSRFAK